MCASDEPRDALSRDVTLWLKRMRKAGHRLRYVLVFERHKSMLWHAHVVVSGEDTLQRRDLADRWTHGHSKFLLVRSGPAAAWYVAKYLSKEVPARVRASNRYGRSVSAGTALLKRRDSAFVTPPLLS